MLKVNIVVHWCYVVSVKGKSHCVADRMEATHKKYSFV